MPQRWFQSERPLVLIVDDDQTTCALAHAYLQLEGYKVRTAANGQEALAALGDCVPCAMVVDLRMPIMDGVELRQRQLANTSVADVPFILMSAWPELRLAAANLGAADVLEKPFGNEELKEAIERVRRIFRRP